MLVNMTQLLLLQLLALLLELVAVPTLTAVQLTLVMFVLHRVSLLVYSSSNSSNSSSSSSSKKKSIDHIELSSLVLTVISLLQSCARRVLQCTTAV
jgi:hypothetical protein